MKEYRKDENMNTFSHNLKKLRISRGLTRDELAKLIHMPKNSIVNYELGRKLPGYDAIVKFEDFYRVSAADLSREVEISDQQVFDEEMSVDNSGAEEKLGIRLKSLRKKAGLTQQKLADIFGISKYSIWHYENGSKQPGCKVLANYEEFFRVTASYLLGTTEENDYDLFASHVALKSGDSDPHTIGDADIGNVASSIRKIRKLHGMTQVDFAESLGLTEITIQCYENGRRKPNLNTLIKLEQLYGVTPMQLAGISREPVLRQVEEPEQSSEPIESTEVKEENGSGLEKRIAMLERSERRNRWRGGTSCR